MAVNLYNDSQFAIQFLNDLPLILKDIEGTFAENKRLSNITLSTTPIFITKKRNALKAFNKVENFNNRINLRVKNSLTNDLKTTGLFGKAASNIIERVKLLWAKVKSGTYTRENMRELLQLLNILIGILQHIHSLESINIPLSDIKDYKDAFLDSM